MAGSDSNVRCRVHSIAHRLMGPAKLQQGSFNLVFGEMRVNVYQ